MHFLTVHNRLWFIEDRQLRLAFEVLMKHHSRFHQLDSLKGLDMQFSETMLLEHTPAVVLNMVNRYKYLPELIIVHVGALDFSRVTNHQIWTNIHDMVINSKKITTVACRSTDLFRGFMFLLMLSLPFYINCYFQWPARWARACFNGLLAKHAQLNGGYIIKHLGTTAVTDLGLYYPNNQGDLTEIGYLLMKEIAHRVQTIVALFTVVMACKRQPMVMNNAIQAALRRDNKQ